MKLTFTPMTVALTMSFHFSSQHHIFFSTGDSKHNLRTTESKLDFFYLGNPDIFLAILLFCH